MIEIWGGMTPLAPSGYAYNCQPENCPFPAKAVVQVFFTEQLR